MMLIFFDEILYLDVINDNISVISEVELTALHQARNS